MAQSYFYPPSLAGITGSGTQSVDLVDVGGSPITLGQKTAANSLPIVIASDQTLPLPSGAATAANQASEIALLTARLAGSLVPTAYDEVALTYVTVGNGIGQIQTAVYKLATSTVKTLTLSYDASDRLSGVVAS